MDEEKNPIINGKLYGIYSVISNKTVRRNEKLFERWFNKSKNVPGRQMIHTNRGWFIDGHEVDEKSVETWFSMTKLDRDWFNKKK